MFNLLSRGFWIFSTISSIFYFHPNKVFQSVSSKKNSLDINEVYDFIVVGGGTAGCIVANRLSENPSVSVLLIEAGGEEPVEATIPAIAPYLQLTEIDWQYKSAPSATSCLGMNDNRCNLPRGKVLGGSSSINFMLYVRGNRRDFDSWWQAGNSGWKFSDIIEYFKKSEDNLDAKYNINQDYHGIGGYQKVKEPVWKTPLSAAFLEAGQELGYQIEDINGKDQVGFMYPQGFYDEGSRYSSSRSFINPIRDRPNLHIKLHSHVTKVIFNKTRAVGIKFLHEDRTYSVKIHREVILCAGAIGTPHLLMLSGVGPRKHITRFNITPIVDLAVGKNLQDHVAGALPFILNKSLSLSNSRYESIASLYQYIVWKSGPLSTLGAVEGIGFINSRFSNKSLQWPDIQFHLVSGSYASDDGHYLRHTINVREEIWENYLRPLSEVDSFTIIVKLMRPKSRGRVEISSNDAREMPKIITNYLSDPLDSLVLLDGLEIAQKLGRTSSFKRYGSRFYDHLLPGCEKHSPRYSDYWICFLRTLTLTIYHYCGTTKMGPYWDSEAVVDPQLRVYNIAGLRVIDASIFPTIPTGNINAAVMMVAEKGADMVKEFWQKKIQRVLDKDPDEIQHISNIFRNESEDKYDTTRENENINKFLRKRNAVYYKNTSSLNKFDVINISKLLNIRENKEKEVEYAAADQNIRRRSQIYRNRTNSFLNIFTKLIKLIKLNYSLDNENEVNRDNVNEITSTQSNRVFYNIFLKSLPQNLRINSNKQNVKHFNSSNNLATKGLFFDKSFIKKDRKLYTIFKKMNNTNINISNKINRNISRINIKDKIMDSKDKDSAKQIDKLSNDRDQKLSNSSNLMPETVGHEDL